MSNYLVELYEGKEIDWKNSDRITAINFSFAAERYAQRSLDKEWLVNNPEFEVQIKCVETGEIKRFEINVNVEFDVLEVIEDD